MNHLNSQKGIAPIILILILAVAAAGVGGAQYFKKQQAKQVAKSNVTGETANWKIYTDTKNGLSFQYPVASSTDYLQYREWPPIITVSSVGSPFQCEENQQLKTELGYGYRKIVMVGSQKYCLTESGDNAMSHYYPTYEYIALKGGKQFTVKFGMTFMSCDNYDNDVASVCNKEQEVFRGTIDALVDKMLSTFKFIK